MTVRYSHSPHVLERRSFDRWLLLTDALSEPIVLAGTSAQVWQLLRHWSSVEDVAISLSATYQLDVSDIIADITPVIVRLSQLKMLMVHCE
ncbi:MAG: PqqD family peptide modification chaperone [Acidimicrobiia bacterium]